MGSPICAGATNALGSGGRSRGGVVVAIQYTSLGLSSPPGSVFVQLLVSCRPLANAGPLARGLCSRRAHRRARCGLSPLVLQRSTPSRACSPKSALETPPCPKFLPCKGGVRKKSWSDGVGARSSSLFNVFLAVVYTALVDRYQRDLEPARVLVHARKNRTFLQVADRV